MNTAYGLNRAARPPPAGVPSVTVTRTGLVKPASLVPSAGVTAIAAFSAAGGEGGGRYGSRRGEHSAPGPPPRPPGPQPVVFLTSTDRSLSTV
jgi:hypothetical protein